MKLKGDTESLGHNDAEESFSSVDTLSSPQWTEADEQDRQALSDSMAAESAAADRDAAIATAREQLEAVAAAGAPVEAIERHAEIFPGLEIGSATSQEKHKANEDSFAASPEGWGVVGDGVGSGDNGKAASSASVAYLSEELARLDQFTERSVIAKELSEMLASAHDRLTQANVESGTAMAAAASVVKLVRDGDRKYAVIGNVGDSPVYLMRGNRLRELTNYHRDLAPRDERPALGKPLDIVPNVFSLRLKPGDRILLTSNGVRKNSPKLRPIKKLLKKNPDPQAAASALVTKLTGKSHDARTAVIMTIASKKH